MSVFTPSTLQGMTKSVFDPITPVQWRNQPTVGELMQYSAVLIEKDDDDDDDDDDEDDDDDGYYNEMEDNDSKTKN